MFRTLTEYADEVLLLMGQASEPITKEDEKYQKAVMNLCHAVKEAESPSRESQFVPHSGF